MNRANTWLTCNERYTTPNVRQRDAMNAGVQALCSQTRRMSCPAWDTTMPARYITECSTVRNRNRRPRFPGDLPVRSNCVPIRRNRLKATIENNR